MAFRRTIGDRGLDRAVFGIEVGVSEFQQRRIAHDIQFAGQVFGGQAGAGGLAQFLHAQRIAFLDDEQQPFVLQRCCQVLGQIVRHVFRHMRDRIVQDRGHGEVFLVPAAAEDHRQAALPRQRLGIGADAARMSHPGDAGRGQRQALQHAAHFGDGGRHRHLAETVPPVDPDHAGGQRFDGGHRLSVDEAGVEPPRIFGHAHDAMRLKPAERRVDEVIGDGHQVRGAGALGAQHRGGDFAHRLGRDRARHAEIPCIAQLSLQGGQPFIQRGIGQNGLAQLRVGLQQVFKLEQQVFHHTGGHDDDPVGVTDDDVAGLTWAPAILAGLSMEASRISNEQGLAETLRTKEAKGNSASASTSRAAPSTTMPASLGCLARFPARDRPAAHLPTTRHRDEDRRRTSRPGAGPHVGPRHTQRPSLSRRPQVRHTAEETRF